MELLKDPGNTRVYKGLPLPPQKPLRSDLLFQNGTIQLGLLKEFLKKEGKVSVEDYKKIVKQAIHIFSTTHHTQKPNPTSLPSTTPLPSSVTSTDNSMTSSNS